MPVFSVLELSHKVGVAAKKNQHAAHKPAHTFAKKVAEIKEKKKNVKKTE